MTVLGTIVAIFALLLAFWLRAAGTTVTRIPRADALRDASDGKAGATRVAEMLEARETITPAVGMVASALLVIAAVLGMAVVASDDEIGSALAAAILVGLIVLIFGDFVPRQIGRRSSPALAYRSSRLVGLAMAIGGWANDLIPEAAADSNGATEAPGGEPDEVQERDLIDSVLEFGETVVREVMTPRPDMVTVPFTATIEELVAIAAEEGFSRVPVTDDGDVVGIVIVKELLPLLSDGQRPSVMEVMRAPEFVPESKLASALLSEMQENHNHQMIVVDEYGEVSGLVTIEDLLEELVGEISDETDEEEVFIVSQGEGVWTVDARLSVEALGDAVGVELPDEDWDTVGGLVLGLAERVPEVGEEFSHGPLTLAVTRMQGRRVSKVRVSVEQSVEAG